MFPTQFFRPGPQQQRRPAQLQDSLTVFSAGSMSNVKLEYGNKILLPGSMLQQLIHIRQNGPMIFRLQSTQTTKFTYAGVLEFTAEEGTCIVPNWMFEQMGFFEGCIAMISFVQMLPKGKLIRIQPHETAFIDLADPRAILESQLRNFITLTEGETITIHVGGKGYQIDIVKIEPNTEFKAVNINEADVEIDFLPPLDYTEAPPNLVKKQSSINYEEQQKQKQGFFVGIGVRLDGKQGVTQARKQSEEVTKEAYNPRKHKLQNGIKSNEDPSLFQGNAITLGNTKAPLKKK